MKKTKFPIILKVILAGLLVSFVTSAVMFAVNYNNQTKNAIASLHKGINNSFNNLKNYYSSDTNVNNLKTVRDYVKEGRSDYSIYGYDYRVEQGTEYDLAHYNNKFSDFCDYYKSVDPWIYDNGFGFTPAKGEFQSKYVTLTNALITTKITSGATNCYAAFVDPNNRNRIVFVGDVRQIEYKDVDNPPFYYMAGSYYEFKNPLPATDKNETVVRLTINGKTTKAMPILFDVTDLETFVYIIVEYSEAAAVIGVKQQLTSEIIILSIVTVIIILMYALLSYFLFVRNINKLSKASKEISKKLANKNLGSPTEIKVHSHDEMSTLADSISVLQDTVYNYANLVEKEAKEREKINTELEVASKIQLEALPPSDYVDEKVLLKAYIKTAKEVGGDFYDYFYIDESRFAILIADVSGKGIPASLFMMRSKAIIKNEILSNDNLEDAIYKANNILVSNNKENLFITTFIGVIDLKKNEMTYVNAGHEKPYIVSKGKVNKLDGASNFVIGEIDNFKYETEKVRFTKDDLLFMFTDGLNESINSQKEEFGYQRIEEILAKSEGLSFEQLLALFNEEHKQFIGKEEPFDDITMLLFKSSSGSLHLEFDKKDYSIIEEATNRFYENYSYLDETVKAHVGIALDELLNNQISYEERDDLKINIDFKLNKNELNLTITSNGFNFNPFNDLKDKKKGKDIGGHGINIVKNITKKQDYKYQNNQSIIDLIF